MSQSARLRLQDVRAAFRIVGDCRDFGADPAEWNRVLVRRLSAHFGCFMSAALVATHRAEAGACEPVLLADDWPHAGTRQRWLDFVHGERYRELPSAVAFARPFARVTTARREDLIPIAVWRKSAERNELRVPCGQDEFAYSAAPVAGSPGRFFGLVLSRPAGEPALTARDRNLIALLHEELAALVGTRLLLRPNEVVAGLSPRLREVLGALLEGDTEKQLAVRLGLSHHTVHEYVATLYRRFGVRSRADLMRVSLQARGET